MQKQSIRKQRGDNAEERAARYLEGIGLKVVERNYRCRAGEIDIVLRDGKELVFAEVRSRADGRYGQARETVRWKKRRKLVQLAGIYLAHRRPTFSSCRFDVVGVTDDTLTWVRDAFRDG